MYVIRNYGVGRRQRWPARLLKNKSVCGPFATLARLYSLYGAGLRRFRWESEEVLPFEIALCMVSCVCGHVVWLTAMPGRAPAMTGS